MTIQRTVTTKACQCRPDCPETFTGNSQKKYAPQCRAYATRQMEAAKAIRRKAAKSPLFAKLPKLAAAKIGAIAPGTYCISCGRYTKHAHNRCECGRDRCRYSV